MKLINTKNSRDVILINLLVNGMTGFYIFVRAFNDKNFGFANLVFTLLCVGVVVGIISGTLLKTCRFIDVLVSVSPLFGFFGLFVAGSLEKAGFAAIIVSLFNFTLPLIFEGGAWFLGASISKRMQK